MERDDWLEAEERERLQEEYDELYPPLDPPWWAYE